MKANVLAIGMLLAAAGSGCHGSGPRPPGPVPQANAMVDSYSAIFVDRPGGAAADVILTARCVSCDEFGRRRAGDWNQHWQFAKFNVIAVEKGNWDEPDLSFVCMIKWPTPESGIMVSMPPWPYQPGVEMRFWLDSAETPARVLGQETITSFADLRDPSRG